MTPRHATPNFDLIARPYRWLEFLAFGPALTRCRNHFLPAIAGRRTALVLGDGDGRFLARLLAANPELHADTVDTSPAMLHLLTRRTRAAHPSAATRLRTHETSALTFTPTGPYDLIVTHFFLDCLTQPELDALTIRLAPHLAPNALWLVSDFRIPAGPLEIPARILVRSLYFAFRLVTGLRTHCLPDHTATLRAASFTRTAQHVALAGILTTELWAYTPAALPEYTPLHATATTTPPQPPSPGSGPRSRTAQPIPARARPRRLPPRDLST